MAKTKVKTKFRITKKNWPKVFVLIIVLGVVGYFAIYQPIAIKMEKNRFLDAKASLEELSGQIQAKIGKPDQIKQEESCSYSSREFERGPRSCSSSIYLLYEDKDYKSSSDLMESVRQLVATKLIPGAGEQHQAQFVPVGQNNNQSFDQDYEVSISGISCGLRYRYPLYPTYRTIDKFEVQHEENLQVELACSGSAKAEHFPVKN